jgi:hypothetical protein
MVDMSYLCLLPVTPLLRCYSCECIVFEKVTVNRREDRQYTVDTSTLASG